jgi:hypothetical protein
MEGEEEVDGGVGERKEKKGVVTTCYMLWKNIDFSTTDRISKKKYGELKVFEFLLVVFSLLPGDYFQAEISLY